MKLNDDQRIVMQAVLDGKTVKFKTEEIYTWRPLSIEDIGIIGEPDVEYLIEPKKKTIKVAVFKADHSDKVFIANPDWEKCWTRVSEIVYILRM